MTRVSENSQSTALKYAINMAKSKMEDLQLKGSTLKKVRRPSDDPVANIESLNLQAKNVDNDQYLKNSNYAMLQLSATESSLQQLTEVMMIAKERAIAQASDIYNPEIRKNVANEIRELLNQTLSIANKRIGNRYIFSGFSTLKAPFDIKGSYFGDEGHMTLEVSKDFFTPINLNGKEVFYTSENSDYRNEHPLDEFPDLYDTRNFLYRNVPKDQLKENQNFIDKGRLEGSIYKSKPSPIDADFRQKDNLFQQLNTFVAALENNDANTIQSLLEKFDSSISRLVTLRTRIGSITKNIEISKDILESQIISNKERRSYLVDSDIAELFADMIKQESILKTAYKTGNNTINQTLLDFIR
mgnify:CR=1 FL=1